MSCWVAVFIFVESRVDKIMRDLFLVFCFVVLCSVYFVTSLVAAVMPGSVRYVVSWDLLVVMNFLCLTLSNSGKDNTSYCDFGLVRLVSVSLFM